MADPFTILGLSSNIISFIQFGFTVVSASKAVRDSVHGTTPEVHDLKSIVEDVQELIERVDAERKAGRALTKEERHIVEMAKECEMLVKQLQHAIDKLKIRDGASSRWLESTKIVVKGMWKRGEIDELKVRLETLVGRLRHSLSEVLQRDRDSSILSKLNQLEKSHQELQISYDFKPRQICSKILDLLENDGADDMSEGAANTSLLTSLKSNLDLLQEERRTCEIQTKVLESLYFEEIDNRWETISEAASRTNAWLFDRTVTTFVDWLEDESGFYWITGLAGSGKSTLMKYAFEHEETRRVLSKWAGPVKLHMANYAFWSAGSEMQTSQKGLVQSILYHILRGSPNLIPHVSVDHLHHEAWSMKGLKKAFCNIFEQTLLPARYCLFIDALDEYNGDEEEAVEFLTFLARSANIKICVSSRPRSIFEEFFTNKKATLAMQDFTRDDMENYVWQTVSENKKFQALHVSRRDFVDLIQLIVSQAHGVWLWAYLVTRDMTRAMNRHADLQKLYDIVNDTPSGLEEIFKHMISKVKKMFRDEMARMLLVTLAAYQDLPVTAYPLLEKERREADYAIKAPFTIISRGELVKKMEACRQLVQDRCGDLLVVYEDFHDRHWKGCYRVRVLHRTFHDFLKLSYQDQLEKDLTTQFDPWISLCNIELFLNKISVKEPDMDLNNWGRVLDPSNMLRYAGIVDTASHSLETLLFGILEEYDRMVRCYWHCHKTGLSISGVHEDYPEGCESSSILSHYVNRGMVKYVRRKLNSNAQLIHRFQPPLLVQVTIWLAQTAHTVDTAERCLGAYSKLKLFQETFDMVQLLLEFGADPNLVQPNLAKDSDETIWALYLKNCLILCRLREDPNFETVLDRYYESCKLFIKYGARSDSMVEWLGGHITVPEALNRIFGAEKAETLLSIIDQVHAQRRRQQEPQEPSWSGWILNFLRPR